MNSFKDILTDELMAQKKEGVLVGCNEVQEWLLPWWWDHFRKNNAKYPVAFADFGMSPQSRSWCRARGSLLPIPEPLVASLDTLDTQTSSHWEKMWKESGEMRDLWALRQTWYKKPVAFAHSPFARTLWLDLDCEVRGALDPLFSLPLSPAKMAASSVETNQLPQESEIGEFPHYNTGVVLFERDSPLIHLWIREIQQGSRLACTEEDLLSFLIAYCRIPLSPLPHACNWEPLRYGDNPHALIYHWMGERGKREIQLQTNE